MFYERRKFFCFGEKPQAVSLVQIIFFGFVVIFSVSLSPSKVLASNLIKVIERDVDIKPFFDIFDQKLRKYTNSYFNIITTYHGSFVNIGRYANFIIIERGG
ncbi:hypothetical protein [Stappia sp. ES.058]|uniref:hypothetical protein n=1 Tax=Stappia sp. ES.058 TaxID=1881061 RepID=UPI0012FDBC77|nr:hypothetical protein [Stappia sp. ES.058]